METEVVQDCLTCMVKPNYHIFKPSEEGDFEAQWESCFDNLICFLSNHIQQSVFIGRVFVAAENDDEFRERSAFILKYFEEINLPVSVLSESPEKPNLVMIEAGFADASRIHVDYGRAGDIKYSKLSQNSYTEYWLAGVTKNRKSNTISDSAEEAFSELQKAFQQLGLGYNHIVRQWNYIEKIYNFQDIGNKPRQHYQLFNEVRNNFYSTHRSLPNFPAATGIGVDHNGITIECMLASGDKNLKVVPISNPKQLNSYKYGQTVLKGEPANKKTNNQPPQFERAKLITNGLGSRVFISGTASIVGQETIGLNDVETQTRVTIDNIELLTSKMNLKSHCPELKSVPENYAYVRVYVKNEFDLPKVKAICLEHFGNAPITFVKADICRSDLLVEIEAEKIS